MQMVEEAVQDFAIRRTIRLSKLPSVLHPSIVIPLESSQVLLMATLQAKTHRLCVSSGCQTPKPLHRILNASAKKRALIRYR